MKKTLTVVFVLMAVLLLFCSCDDKNYNGFNVKGDYIILPLPEEAGSEIRVPLCMYKAVEVTIEPLINDITAFKPISENTLAKYYGYEDTVMAEVEKQIADAEINPKKLGASMTENEYGYTELLISLPGGYASEVAYILEEVNDVVAGDSLYYYSVKDVFEEETSDLLEYDSMLKLWFPQFTYISTYEATTYAKENPNAGKSLSKLYEDALNSTIKEYEKVVNRAVKEYEDSLNEYTDLYSDVYDETLDLYEKTLNEYSNLYSDAYNEALDIYGDAYEDVLNSLNSIAW
jgi:hypothetical protein